MRRYRKLLFICWILFFIIGCSSESKEDTVQEMVDYGTGKTQVDTYQKLKKQIRSLQKEKSEETFTNEHGGLQ